MEDINKTTIQIHDFLIPKLKLDVWERSLYLHLFRHTWVIGTKQAMFSIDGLSLSTAISIDKVRKSVRTMHEKGCIKIEERSRKGHLIRVITPYEIDGIVPKKEEKKSIDIESLDFFNNRNYVEALLDREDSRCFYCLRTVTKDDCELDHVISQVNNGDNSYRNIVASCHDCNTTKQDKDPEDFLRSLFREGLISKKELKNRLEALDHLQAGELKPMID